MWRGPMVSEITPRCRNRVRCPVNGNVHVVSIRLDEGDFAWCTRSGLVCQVGEARPGCPLTNTVGPFPLAALWACPLGKLGLA